MQSFIQYTSFYVGRVPLSGVYLWHAAGSNHILFTQLPEACKLFFQNCMFILASCTSGINSEPLVFVHTKQKSVNATQLFYSKIQYNNITELCAVLIVAKYLLLWLHRL
jgi:hypothetical protein